MPAHNSTGLGARLRQLRGEKSQAEFAREVGLTRSALANYETERTTPKPSVLRKISAKVGISEDFLLDGIVRNEFELDRVVTGNGMTNACHETGDELAILRVLRATRPETVKTIVGMLLQEIENVPEVRRQLVGQNADLDVSKLGEIYRNDGVFAKGGDREEMAEEIRKLARRLRGG